MYIYIKWIWRFEKRAPPRHTAMHSNTYNS